MENTSVPSDLMTIYNLSITLVCLHLMATALSCRGQPQAARREPGLFSCCFARSEHVSIWLLGKCHCAITYPGLHYLKSLKELLLTVSVKIVTREKSRGKLKRM